MLNKLTHKDQVLLQVKNSLLIIPQPMLNDGLKVQVKN
jgi:hypothetical protein